LLNVDPGSSRRDNRGQVLLVLQIYGPGSSRCYMLGDNHILLYLIMIMLGKRNISMVENYFVYP
jgi:hypothetical protein